MQRIQVLAPRRIKAEIERLAGLRANCTLRKKTSAHYKVMPWASGTGSTTELYVSPKESGLTDANAHWRISMASVPESGPFSMLPAYQRIITVVEGEGFRLTGDMGTDVEVRPGVIHPFSGAETINCELLGGPCLDLNLMYQEDKVNASLALLKQVLPVHPVITTQSSKEKIIVICLGGQVSLWTHGKMNDLLFPRNSVCFSSNEGQGELILVAPLHSKFALISIETIR